MKQIQIREKTTRELTLRHQIRLSLAKDWEYRIEAKDDGQYCVTGLSEYRYTNDYQLQVKKFEVNGHAGILERNVDGIYNMDVYDASYIKVPTLEDVIDVLEYEHQRLTGEKQDIVLMSGYELVNLDELGQKLNRFVTSEELEN